MPKKLIPIGSVIGGTDDKKHQQGGNPMKYGKLGNKAEIKKPGTRKKIGKGGTAKAKADTMKYRAAKKAKKSKAMYA